MGLVLKVVIVISIGLESTGSERGYAAHYSPGVMERVARTRHLSIVHCMVSSPVYSIGTWVYVEGINTGKRLKCRITDVSAPKDKNRHIRMNLLTELGYANTLDICGSTKLPNRQCPVLVWKVKSDESSTRDNHSDTHSGSSSIKDGSRYYRYMDKQC